MQLLQDGCNGPAEIAAVLARVCRGMEKDVPALTQTVSGCLATSSTASEQLSEPCKALLSGVGEVRKHIASGTGHKALLERLDDAVLGSALLSSRRSYQHHGYACGAGKAEASMRRVMGDPDAIPADLEPAGSAGRDCRQEMPCKRQAKQFTQTAIWFA